jgi:hypothetical protein
MAEPKPFASLSSGLLARKGQAKPAMRPQGFSSFGAMTNGHDDLGWNDMGFEPPQPSTVVDEVVQGAVSPADLPPVLRERVELAEELSAVTPASADLSPMPLLAKKPTASKPAKRQALDSGPAKTPAVARGSKAAFTLRLDADRHLQLRLACAVQNRSAQQLVTAALDQYLQSIPEVAEIAGRLPARKAN